MIRHSMTLVLGGLLGSMVLVGNAEACHKKRCGHMQTVCAAPAPVVCVAPAPRPATCVTPMACAPKVKHCSFKLPTFCHKKPVCAKPVAPCGPTVMAYASPVSYPIATPQASAQH
jgi:hypothetical protein